MISYIIGPFYGHTFSSHITLHIQALDIINIWHNMKSLLPLTVTYLLIVTANDSASDIETMTAWPEALKKGKLHLPFVRLRWWC